MKRSLILWIITTLVNDWILACLNLHPTSEIVSQEVCCDWVQHVDLIRLESDCLLVVVVPGKHSNSIHLTVREEHQLCLVKLHEWNLDARKLIQSWNVALWYAWALNGNASFKVVRWRRISFVGNKKYFLLGHRRRRFSEKFQYVTTSTLKGKMCLKLQCANLT